MVWVPLTYPLPARNWIQGKDGTWSSIAWTKNARASAEANRGKWVPRDSVRRTSDATAVQQLHRILGA